MSEKIDIQIVNEQPTLSFKDSSVVLSLEDSSSPSLAFTDSSVNLSIGDSIAPSLALNGGATSVNLSVGNSSNEIQLVATGTPGPKGVDGSGGGGGGLNTEDVQDVVGAMFTGNTETRITVEYKDEDGTIDFVVDDMTANTQLPLIDSDTMSGASSTNVASAESVKAYVDSKTHLELGTSSTTALAGDTALLQLGTSGTTALAGDTTTISGAQASAIIANTAKVDLTVDGAGTVHANNYTNTTPDATNVAAAGALMDSELTDLSGVKGVTISTLQVKPSEGAFADGDKTKLNGIAAGAEVNVNADWNSSSGDSQILNKPTIPAAYADADAVSAVATADDYLKNDAADTITGDLTIDSSFLYINDQSGSGVASRVTTVALTAPRTVSLPDASGTIAITTDIPTGVENNADVTDAANVTAAGALMDSELTDLSGIKSLDTSTLVTISGTQTISGDKTFSGILAAPKRKFVKTETTTHFDVQGDILYFGSGSTTQGDLCYLKEDGTWGQADADGAAVGDDEDRDAMGMLAIALGTNPLVDGMFIRGVITMDYDLGDCGNPVYVKITAGGMTHVPPSASGDFLRVVGYCIDDTHGLLYFNPDSTWVEIA